MKKKSIKGEAARQLVAKAVRWSSLRPYQRLSIMQIRGRTLRTSINTGKTATAMICFPSF